MWYDDTMVVGGGLLRYDEGMARQFNCLFQNVIYASVARCCMRETFGCAANPCTYSKIHVIRITRSLRQRVSESYTGTQAWYTGLLEAGFWLNPRYL